MVNFYIYYNIYIHTHSYIHIYIYIFIFINIKKIMVNLKRYSDIDQYRNILFHWSNQYSLWYENDSLVLHMIWFRKNHVLIHIVVSIFIDSIIINGKIKPMWVNLYIKKKKKTMIINRIIILFYFMLCLNDICS